MRILFYILDIPYIRLFTRHVFSANSTLKQCIKSTQINISRNHSKSLNLPDLQETVSNLRECIFHDFDVLANSGKWMHAEKTWYTVHVYFIELLSRSYIHAPGQPTAIMINMFWCVPVDVLWHWAQISIYIVHSVQVCSAFYSCTYQARQFSRTITPVLFPIDFLCLHCKTCIIIKKGDEKTCSYPNNY